MNTKKGKKLNNFQMKFHMVDGTIVDVKDCYVLETPKQVSAFFKLATFFKANLVFSNGEKSVLIKTQKIAHISIEKL